MPGLGRIVRRLSIGLAACLAASAVLAQTPPTPAPAAPVAPAARPATLPPTTVAPSEPALPGARLAPGQPIPPAELEAFVDGVVGEAMTHDHIVGVTVSVVQNGQILLKKGYGYASLSPLRAVDADRSLFRIGSISKTFTWILLMKQVEAGRMNLERPINHYLPESLRVPDQGYAHQILVRQLMNHTPGLEDRVLGQLFENDFKRVRPLDVYLRQERPHRVREPGTLPSYSNYGAALAGASVAETTGQPYETLVEAQILNPLGLGHTTFREPHPVKAGMPAPMPAALAADLAKPYRWTPSGYRERQFEFLEHVAPAGAGSSSAGDMARYMLMLLGSGALEGVQIYGPVTAQAFETPLPRPIAGVGAWRHGLAEYNLPGGFTGVGHSGGTLSFFSNMVVTPKLGLGVFVAVNTESGGGLTEALPKRVVARFYGPPPAPPPPGSLALVRDRSAFEGHYLTTRRAYHGLEGFVFRLVRGQSIKVSPEGRLVVAGPGFVTRLSPVGSPTAGRFVDDDGVTPVVFEMRNGVARRYFTGGGAAERQGILRQPIALILLTVLTAIAAIATLGGLISRLRRDYRESTAQKRAGLMEASQAALWIAAMALFGGWAMNTNDLASVMYDWPGVPLMLASTCALVAAAMAAGNTVFLPFVWRGGRRVDSWTTGRKMRFTLTALIFLAYAVFLATWGALEPWSG